MMRAGVWLQVALDTHHAGTIDHPHDPRDPAEPSASSDEAEFWQAFDEAEEWAAIRPVPWYRRVGMLFVVLFVAGLLATGALLPWGELFERRDNVSDPFDILAVAEQTVDESPYGWLVEDVRIRDIVPSGVGGFVHSAPGDGIITIDLIGWQPQELRSTVAHEIGHLLDFAAYRDATERRDGLESEVWAECAAVDAGFRRTDPGGTDAVYRCTDQELEQYQFSVSLLGEVCAPWSDQCGVVSPISAG